MAHHRSTLTLATTTALGLVGATIMIAMPGEAAPSPTTFAAEASGQVWRINRVDQDMSGDALTVGLDVGSVRGETGSVAAPDRSVARADNVSADPMPAGAKSVVSTATATQDTVGTLTSTGQAGSVTDVLDFATSSLSARGRWGGDTSCLTATTPLTQSSSTTGATGIVPGAIPAGTPTNPIPLPTSLPTEFPTEAPSGFPTELPTDLPLPTPTETGTGLPTGLPTDLPTGLPTDLPTDLPTTLPSLPFPRSAQRAEGDVAMFEVAPATVEQSTFLGANGENTRRVEAQARGRLADATKPAAEFFGGQATLLMTGQPTLSVYSTGNTNGSQVTWQPPTMKLVSGGTTLDVPTDGSAVAIPYAQNDDVVATVSAGQLSSAESPTGTLAQAAVTVLNVLIKNGDDVVLDAELFPMAVKAAAPTGGVDCTPVVTPPTVKDAGLALKGRNNGPKADKLAVLAKPIAHGAQVTVFTKDGKKVKRVDTAKLDKQGDRAFSIKDKNGKKPTTYVVKLGRTDLTKPATATRKIR